MKGSGIGWSFCGAQQAHHGRPTKIRESGLRAAVSSPELSRAAELQSSRTLRPPARGVGGCAPETSSHRAFPRISINHVEGLPGIGGHYCRPASPAIRFGLGVSYLARALQQELFPATLPVFLQPAYPPMPDCGL